MTYILLSITSQKTKPIHLRLTKSLDILMSMSRSYIVKRIVSQNMQRY
jgi:hypothetical protein